MTYLSAVTAPNGGIDPDSELELRSSSCRPVSDDTAGGSVPLKLLNESTRDVSCARLPRAADKVPLS